MAVDAAVDVAEAVAGDADGADVGGADAVDAAGVYRGVVAGLGAEPPFDNSTVAVCVWAGLTSFDPALSGFFYGRLERRALLAPEGGRTE